MAWLLLVALFVSISGADMYTIGLQGDSCYKTCLNKGLECSDSIVTNNSTAIFQQLGINCIQDQRYWWANDQPAYISDPNDPNYRRCLGVIGVPQDVWCGGHYPASQRLCHCVDPTPSDQFFGTGYSNGVVEGIEQDIFAHVLVAPHTGVMTHFWVTAMESVCAVTMIRYYIDGETTASIQFIPSLASGVGFSDTTGPWGTRYFSKGAKNGAWNINFRIPFTKSIRVTAQSTDGKTYPGFYMIVRGAQDLPIKIGDLTIPSNSKLVLQRFHQNVSRLAYVPVADIPSGKGLFFMHTIAVKSGNLNFLEGCYHAYSPYNMAYPGILLSTGTEDYFDSAWYFDGGEFRFENAGFTHLTNTGNGIEWSAYRFHFMDPLPFNNGFRLVWRNGDALNPKTGLKCFQQDGGIVVGNPTTSDVQIYAWIYTWN